MYIKIEKLSVLIYQTAGVPANPQRGWVLPQVASWHCQQILTKTCQIQANYSYSLTCLSADPNTCTA